MFALQNFKFLAEKKADILKKKNIFSISLFFLITALRFLRFPFS